MRGGAHGEHPGRRPGPEGVEQEVGEQEGRQVVEGERALEPVRGLEALAEDRPGVVDQARQAPSRGRLDRLGEAPDLGLDGQVGEHELELGAGVLGAQRGEGLLAAGAVAASHQDARPPRRELACHRVPQARGGTRDQEDALRAQGAGSSALVRRLRRALTGLQRTATPSGSWAT